MCIRDSVHTFPRVLQWSPMRGDVAGWHRHRHHAGPHGSLRHDERRVGTSNWPKPGTQTWPPVGTPTFSWPRTFEARCRKPFGMTHVRSDQTSAKAGQLQRGVIPIFASPNQTALEQLLETDPFLIEGQVSELATLHHPEGPSRPPPGPGPGSTASTIF